METIGLSVLLSIVPHVPLITQISKNNYINDGVFVHCYNVSQVLSMQKAFHYSNMKVLAVKSGNFHDYQFKESNILIILDTHCRGWTDVFVRYSKSAYRQRIHWLINTNRLESTTQVLSRYYLEIDSNVILIHKKGSLYNLYEVFNTGFKNSGLFVMRDIGFWNSTLYIRKLRRRNLHGVVLKCVTVITDNLANETFKHFLEESRHDKPDTLHKLKFFTLIQYMQDMFNFSLSVQRTNSWGYSHNGSFDGLVGALQRKEVEFGCSPVLFKINRAKVVNYIVPTWQTKHSFLFRQQKYQSSYFSIYTRPLDVTVWRCMVTVLLIAGLALNLIFRIKVVNAFANESDSSISQIWLLICSAVCQQGMPFNGNAISARIIIFVTFMFSMIIYQFYNANVLSSLLNEQYNNIRNLKDLLESDLKVGVEDMLFNKDYFKRTTDRVPLELYNKKIVGNKQNNFFDAEYGMSMVKRGGFAFHVDTNAAYRIMRRTFSEKEICEVSSVQLFPPQYVGAIAKKGSQYKEYIAIGVSKMLEAGLMNRIKSIWDSRKPPCVKMKYSSIIAVNIREFSMALLFLMCGFMIAIIILVFEIYIIKIKREKRSKRKFYRRKLQSVHFIMYKTKRIKKNRILCFYKRNLHRNMISFKN